MMLGWVAMCESKDCLRAKISDPTEGGQCCDPAAADGFLRSVFTTFLLCFHFRSTDQNTTQIFTKDTFIFSSAPLSFYKCEPPPNTHTTHSHWCKIQIFGVSILIVSMMMIILTVAICKPEEGRQFSAEATKFVCVSIYFETSTLAPVNNFSSSGNFNFIFTCLQLCNWSIPVRVKFGTMYTRPIMILALLSNVRRVLLC